MPLDDSPPPYGTVVFDCDSTLSAMEGIEALAGPEHAAELARLTADAMEGRVALEKVYGRRLELVRPDRSAVAGIGAAYVERLLPNAREVVAALLGLGKYVVIVSGGLLPAVRHLGRALGIADVFAVDVRWDESGAYAGFDETSPLAKSGGKIDVLAELAAETRGGIVFVGDGVTDLEAAGHAERFIAYGGVERREAVFREARVTCDSPDYKALLPMLLAPEELETLRADPLHATLFTPLDTHT